MSRKPTQGLIYAKDNKPTGDAVIRYFITLDSPTLLPSLNGIMNHITASSVIGMFASQYGKKGIGTPGDERFNTLFLSDKVKWSALYPACGESVEDVKASSPAPLYLVKKKYVAEGELELANTEAENIALNAQPKPLTDMYAVTTDNGYTVIKPKNQTEYHNSINGDSLTSLYVQESLRAHQVFGGEIEVAQDAVDDVIALLEKSDIAFGRSKSAQYAACSLIKADIINPSNEQVEIESGDEFYAVLQSDLLICDEGGLYTMLPEDIADAFDCELISSQCTYSGLFGFNAMWRLRKNVKRTVAAGSYYRLKAKHKMTLSKFSTVGENTREGFGKFEIITVSQMQRRTDIEKGKVFVCSGENKTDNFDISKIEAAIDEERRVAAVYEGADDYFNYNAEKAENAKKLINRYNASFIGRVTLMLFESDNDADFVKRMDSIKDNDNCKKIKDDYAKVCSEVSDKISGSTDFKYRKIAFSTILALIKYVLRTKQ